MYATAPPPITMTESSAYLVIGATMASAEHAARVRAALAVLPFFVGLNDVAQAEVASAAICLQYAADQIVFHEGDPSSGLYIVESGWLKAMKLSVAGREQTLRVVGPGEVFNDISAWVDNPHHATVIALEAATVWLIPRPALLHVLRTYPGLAEAVIKSLAERVIHLVTLIEDLALHTVEGRLARLLLTDAQDGVLHRQRWMTQTELAARLGTVPDVLNRVLRNLVEANLIRVERHQIVILDTPGLERRASIV